MSLREWWHHPWNPIDGCSMGCPYCFAATFARRFKKRFPNGFEHPQFHQNRLGVPANIRKPSRIFVSNMGDFWDPAIEDRKRLIVTNLMSIHRRHRFLILTKRPEFMNKAVLHTMGDNVWLGVTVDRPGTEWRLDFLRTLKLDTKGKFHLFVSYEPLLGPVKPVIHMVEWIVTGPMTNPVRQPEWAWVETIMKRADDAGVPLFMKTPLIPLLPLTIPVRQEYPPALKVRPEEINT